jgi:hypothetical protein
MSDNGRLSTERGEPASNNDVMEAIERMIRALGRRVAQDDPDTVILLDMIRIALDDAYAAGVAGWRNVGFSDAQIGREMGVSKQAVQRRWPRKNACNSTSMLDNGYYVN